MKNFNVQMWIDADKNDRFNISIQRKKYKYTDRDVHTNQIECPQLKIGSIQSTVFSDRL